MNFTEFTQRFPCEASCRHHLRLKREEQGIHCKKCGSTKHYWISTIEKWECSTCHSRTNLRAGTLMEKSKLPLLTWFMTIHLMTSMKKSISALEMQRQLGMKRYEPVWSMMHKIRMAMGNRDDKYELNGEIEIDDAFFEVTDEIKRDELGNLIPETEDQKRGRGSQRQAKVLVMVESAAVAVQDKAHKKGRKMGYAKMIVIDELTSEDINQVVACTVNADASALTDGYASYNKLKQVIKNHIPMKVPPKEADKKLPWAHTLIANAKRLFLGTHHSIRREYLQSYLNEFCYKLNRRNFNTDLFDRMIIAGASSRWY